MEFLYIKTISLKEYLDNLAAAKEVCPHPKDIDFFALALKLGCPIWSIESRLKNQSDVKVINTKELLFLIESLVP
jgi:predicted nucleic acid-binding protein